MNRSNREQQNDLYIVGASYKVESGPVIDTLKQKAEEINKSSIKTVHTGSIIDYLTKDMQLSPFAENSLIDYYRFIEPMLVRDVNAHLSHAPVLLDTTFFYLIPGMSTKGLRSIAEKTKSASLILVDKEPAEIINQHTSYTNKNPWYMNISNVKENVIANKDNFELYSHFFGSVLKIPTKSIIIDADLPQESLEQEIMQFLKNDFIKTR